MASAAWQGSPGGTWLGTLWRLLVFPHAGFLASGSFPGRPATLLTYPSAVGIAFLQWSLLVLGVAWLSRTRRWRAQVFISSVAVVGVALAVLSLALLSGLTVPLD